MPIYERSASSGVEVVDRWADGVGWMAHPDEDAQRVSHAVRGDDGVWVFDPLDGPGVRDHVDELGTVAGVAVLSSHHSRDAEVFAERYGVPVHLPTWMDGVAETVDAPVERYGAPVGGWGEVGDSGIAVRTVDPTTAWKEAIAYRESTGTLRVPDMLSTVPETTLANERLGCYLFHRLAPPRAAFDDVDPERILLGHGEGIFDDAGAALQSALASARRNLPRALVSQAPAQIRGIVGALRG
ncbi:MAG: hypothetical protein ABEJ22_09685 [Haloferacaceae archaeon]